MIKRFILFFCFISILVESFSQVQSRSDCEKLITPAYYYNDQDYLVKISQNEKASFHVTFYENFQYRLVACNKLKNSRVEVTLIDPNNNILYSNIDYDYTQVWDFQFTSTIECVVKMAVVGNEKFDKTELSLLVGYKSFSK